MLESQTVVSDLLLLTGFIIFDNNVIIYSFCSTVCVPGKCQNSVFEVSCYLNLAMTHILEMSCLFCSVILISNIIL